MNNFRFPWQCHMRLKIHNFEPFTANNSKTYSVKGSRFHIFLSNRPNKQFCKFLKKSVKRIRSNVIFAQI